MKKKLSLVLLFVSMATLFLTLSGCGEKGPNTAGSSRFTGLYENTIKPNCASCHVPSGEVYREGKVLLDFSTKSSAYNTLTSKLSVSPSAQYCEGIAYVTAGDPNSSYLAAILIESYSSVNFAGKVNCVPYNIHLMDQQLSEEEKSNIIAWINEGAAQ
ncbi:MAG: hypothetical protein HQK50_03305 [Oligoflexia bacterium]|nr:hypothetical protein [Oligoflexia bacterium]MBF0364570.1 hypothetical protein [Oligoflexia bacterium]